MRQPDSTRVAIRWQRPGSKKSGRADALVHVPPTAAIRGGGAACPDALVGVRPGSSYRGWGFQEAKGGRCCTDGQEPGFGHPSVYLDLAHLRNRIRRRPTWLWRRRACTLRHQRPHGFRPTQMECTPGSEEAEESVQSAFHVRWCKMDGGRFQSQGSRSHAGTRAVTAGE